MPITQATSYSDNVKSRGVTPAGEKIGELDVKQVYSKEELSAELQKRTKEVARIKKYVESGDEAFGKYMFRLNDERGWIKEQQKKAKELEKAKVEPKAKVNRRPKCDQRPVVKSDDEIIAECEEELKLSPIPPRPVLVRQVAFERSDPENVVEECEVECEDVVNDEGNPFSMLKQAMVEMLESGDCDAKETRHLTKCVSLLSELI